MNNPRRTSPTSWSAAAATMACVVLPSPMSSASTRALGSGSARRPLSDSHRGGACRDCWLLAALAHSRAAAGCVLGDCARRRGPPPPRDPPRLRQGAGTSASRRPNASAPRDRHRGFHRGARARIWRAEKGAAVQPAVARAPMRRRPASKARSTDRKRRPGPASYPSAGAAAARPRFVHSLSPQPRFCREAIDDREHVFAQPQGAAQIVRTVAASPSGSHRYKRTA